MWSLFLVLGTQTASATTYGRVLNLTELTEHSTRVVTGTVEESQSFWREDRIWTRVDVDVGLSLVGPRHRMLSFEVLGGSVDGVNLTVPGVPVFEDGREVLLFLDGDSLVGFGQGAFSLEEGIAGRGLGPLLPEGPDSFSVQARLPDREESNECLRPVLWEDYDDGWTLRAVDHLIMQNGELDLRNLQLVGGLEYRFRLCGDQHLQGLDVYLVDEQGEILTQDAFDEREASMLYAPSQSGSVGLFIRPDGMAVDAVGSSLSLSVSYR